MNKTCYWCGNKIPREGAQTKQWVSGSNFTKWNWVDNPTAGKPTVSLSMRHIDPEGLFCRMRCAAEYGIAAAKATEYRHA